MTWNRYLSLVLPLRLILTAKLIVGAFFLSSAPSCVLSQATSKDVTSSHLWNKHHLPYSFKYEGKPSAQLLTNRNASEMTESNASGVTHRYFYVDPVIRLKVTAEVYLYPEFQGVADWVVKFRDDGTSDSSIIKDILPLNLAMPVSPDNIVIHHDKGSLAQFTD
jgi:hypothetical protein